MKNYIKYIIILLSIILVGCILTLLFNSKVKAQRKLKDIQISDYMDGEMILPKSLYKLGSKYKGNLSTEIICKTYNNFAENLIPKYYKNCKNLSEEELIKYFNKNKSIINIELGYDNDNDFIKFIDTIKKLNGEELIFSSYQIIGESVKTLSDYTVAYLGIIYENNDEIIFNTKVLNRLNENATSILFYTDIDEDVLEKEKMKIDENNNNNNNNNTIQVPKSGKVY